MPIKVVLTELRFENLNIVKEQEKTDENFLTAFYPNPEDKNVFNIALDIVKESNPDIILGTDLEFVLLLRTILENIKF